MSGAEVGHVPGGVQRSHAPSYWILRARATNERLPRRHTKGCGADNPPPDPSSLLRGLGQVRRVLSLSRALDAQRGFRPRAQPLGIDRLPALRADPVGTLTLPCQGLLDFCHALFG